MLGVCGRVSLAVILTGASVCADERTDALDAVAPLANALSNGDSELFVRSLPKDLPNREELSTNVAALIAQSEVTSSVKVIGTREGAAELDWYMEIRSRANSMVAERRRGVVTIRFGRKGLREIGPASFFAPYRPAD